VVGQGGEGGLALDPPQQHAPGHRDGVGGLGAVGQVDVGVVQLGGGGGAVEAVGRLGGHLCTIS